MKWKEGPEFENPPAGNHLGRCIQIIDMGTQEHRNPRTGETWKQRDVRLVWELPTELMQGIYKPEVRGKPFAVSGTYKQTLHEASKLRKLLVSWRGRDFTDEEAAAFNPYSLLGQPCSLSLVENDGYINVHSVSGVMRGMQVPPQINPSIYLSLEPAEFDETTFFGLPDKTREKIAGSPEFMELLSMRPHLDQAVGARGPIVPAPAQFRPDPRQTPPTQAYQQAQQYAPPAAPRPPMAPAQPQRSPAAPAHQAPRPPAPAYAPPVAPPAPPAYTPSPLAPEDDVPWPTEGQM